MSETTLVNLVSVLELLLIGGILLVLPRAGRRGLLFGAHVGEEISEGEAAARLKRAWMRGVIGLTLGALAMALWLGLTGHPVAGCLGSLGLLCLGVVALYLKLHLAARALAPAPVPMAERSAAPAPAGEPGSVALPVAALVLCLAGSTWGILEAAERWPEIPERVPTHFGASGEPDAWSSKSFASVFVIPLMNLGLASMIAGIAVLIARAPLALRRDRTQQEFRAQLGFRAATVQMLSGTAVLCTAMLAVLGRQSLQTALGERTGLGTAIWWLAGALLVFVFGFLIRLVWFHGQGGAWREGAAASSPLEGGLADDRCWRWGVFYCNPEDPAILVEKRFGIGYTLNFGNRAGMALFLLLLGFLGGALALILSMD